MANRKDLFDCGCRTQKTFSTEPCSAYDEKRAPSFFDQEGPDDDDDDEDDEDDDEDDEDDEDEDEDEDFDDDDEEYSEDEDND